MKERREASSTLREYAKFKTREWRERNPNYTKNYNRKRFAENPEYWNEYHREWRVENPESRKITRRKGHLKSQYGLSIKDFEAMMYEQGNLCLICKKEMVLGDASNRLTPHVDHCHETGDIRGLLCASCNNGLGCFYDDPNIILDAAVYIMQHQMIHEEK